MVYISTDFDRTAMDFSITEVESNAAFAAGSAKLPLVAALMAEQVKIKDHEKQLVDHGFANYEFDKLPFIIETTGAWSVLTSVNTLTSMQGFYRVFGSIPVGRLPGTIKGPFKSTRYCLEG